MSLGGLSLNMQEELLLDLGEASWVGFIQVRNLGGGEGKRSGVAVNFGHQNTQPNNPHSDD